jgi:hypothetical protein
VNRELDEYVFADPDRANGVIDQALREVGYDSPSAYRVLDSETLSFFEGSPQRTAYFVDQSDSARRATAIAEHPELAHYRSDEQSLHWLFVPADAVRQVAEAIRRDQNARPPRRDTVASTPAPEGFTSAQTTAATGVEPTPGTPAEASDGP